MRFRKGQHVGQWELHDFLCEGGNGEVWKAFRPSDGFAALKILKTNKPDSEQYRRFRSEIEVLQKIGARPGIVHLKDAYLPEKLGTIPPWLAMEIGIPIKDVLGQNSSIEEVVTAIANISVTLSLLAQEGIHHRDIKPDNLFKVGDEWSVGDFGLASYPNKEALTEEGRKLGPMWYIAPEMLMDPTNAIGGPADVYSLAKTLWVLATGQNYPPQGQLRTEIDQIALRSYLTHPRTAMLDLLMEKATEYDPQSRPTMGQFANELQAWLKKLTIPTPPQDISELIARMHPVLIRLGNQNTYRQRQLETFERVLKDICSHLRPFQMICHRDLMRVEQTTDEINSPIQTTVPNGLEQVLPIPDETRRSIRHECPRVEATCRPVGMYGKTTILYKGVVDMRLFEGGDVLFQAAHIVETCLHPTPQQGESNYEVVWKASRTVPIMSAQAEAAINDLLESWNNKFREAIGTFIDTVENTKE